jgi:photosynthetic reaction center H subunit
MQTVGNITGYIDLAQILLYVFWIFFAGLIWYLVRENHREGYPMESSSNGRVVVKGFPIPEPKTFLLEGGKSVTVPDLTRKEPAYNAVPSSPSSGSPIEPRGDGMTAAVGAGAYTSAKMSRADSPWRAADSTFADCPRLHRGSARCRPTRPTRHGG